MRHDASSLVKCKESVSCRSGWRRSSGCLEVRGELLTVVGAVPGPGSSQPARISEAFRLFGAMRGSEDDPADTSTGVDVVFPAALATRVLTPNSSWNTVPSTNEALPHREEQRDRPVDAPATIRHGEQVLSPTGSTWKMRERPPVPHPRRRPIAPLSPRRGSFFVIVRSSVRRPAFPWRPLHEWCRPRQGMPTPSRLEPAC